MSNLDPEGFTREGNGCICGRLYTYGGHVEPGQFDPDCPFHNPSPLAADPTG